MLTWRNAFPGISFPQHESGQTAVQSYLTPGAVQPASPSPTVLSFTEAFLGIPFPQHLSGQTAVQSHVWPGAVQPPSVTVQQGSAVFAGTGQLFAQWGIHQQSSVTFVGTSSLSLHLPSPSLHGVSWVNAFPGIPFPQHSFGQTIVQSYISPGAVQPHPSVFPSVLVFTEAFLGIPLPQHSVGLTKTVQSFVYPGAVSPISAISQFASAVFAGAGVIFIPALSKMNFAGAGQLCVYALVRKGRRGIVVNPNVTGPGVSTNIIIPAKM